MKKVSPKEIAKHIGKANPKDEMLELINSCAIGEGVLIQKKEWIHRSTPRGLIFSVWLKENPEKDISERQTADKQGWVLTIIKRHAKKPYALRKKNPRVSRELLPPLESVEHSRAARPNHQVEEKFAIHL